LDEHELEDFFSILKAYWYEAQVTPQQLVHA